MEKPKPASLTPDNISEGCFGNEYSITIKNYWGETTSGFFEKQHVKDGKLEVEVLEEKGDMVHVMVPGRFIQGREESGGGNFIIVNRGIITPAASEKQPRKWKHILDKTCFSRGPGDNLYVYG